MPDILPREVTWVDTEVDFAVSKLVNGPACESLSCRIQGNRAYCHPDNYKGRTIVLFHNNGNGTFTDVSEKSAVAAPEAKGMGTVTVDLTNDEWPDIMQANGAILDNIHMYQSEVSYMEEKLMFRNLGKAKFDKVSEQLGTDFMMKTADRGLAVGDFDNDGDMDAAIVDREDHIQRYATTAATPTTG